MDERDKAILTRLYAAFSDLSEDDGIAARLVEKEESGLGRTVLTTLHGGFGAVSNVSCGEFYFDEDIFVSRIIVAAEIPEGSRPFLCALIGPVNDKTPAGSFGFDIRENALVYNLRLPIAEGLSEDELVELCDRTMAVAITSAGENAGDLVRAVLP
ncbi:MAG: hypothetical protein K6E91_09160 [Butyrivibrio sp.]|nr:hypothetical protein [Butyrivibrio sp.]